MTGKNCDHATSNNYDDDAAIKSGKRCNQNEDDIRIGMAVPMFSLMLW
jgi:hypothetical protein